MVDALFLRPLPYPEPGRLREVVELFEKEQVPPSASTFRELAQRPDLFTDTAGWVYSLNKIGLPDGPAAEAPTVSATSGLLPMLGGTLLAGRGFTSRDHDMGAEPVALLTASRATALFGDWHGALDREIIIGSTRRRVVGIVERMPAFPPGRLSADVWTPWETPLFGREGERASPRMVVRLAPGIGIGDAQRALRGDGTLAANEAPLLIPVAVAHQSSATGRIVIAAQCIALLLLLVASTNVLHLMLLRQAAKAHDWSVRMALGASQWRLLRQVFKEAIAVSSAAAIIGLLLVPPALQYLKDLLSLSDAALRGTAAMNVLVVTFAGALASLLAVACSLFLLRFLRSGAGMSALRVMGASASEVRVSRRSPRAMLAFQLALAVPLLLAATLLLRSYRSAVSVDPAFPVQDLYAVSLDRAPGHQTLGDTRLLVQRVADIPGVISAAAAGGASLFDGSEERRPLRMPGDRQSVGSVPIRRVAVGYLETLGIAVHKGRSFREGDSESIIVINEAAAAAYWPRQEPIGATITLGARDRYQIVGVVKDARLKMFLEAPQPEVFVLLRNRDAAGQLLFRATADASVVQGRIVEEIRRLSPSQSLKPFHSIADVVKRASQPFRVNAWLLSICAGLALLFAALGAYSIGGVLFDMRTRELGVRLAVGATRRDIVLLLLKDTGRSVAVGLGLGAVLCVPIAFLLRMNLFGVKTTDLASLVLSLAVVTLCALAACAIQAVRASRLDVVRWLKTVSA